MPEIQLQKISDEFISSSGINLHVLRLDLIHPHISGNKWFKLKYNLAEAKKQGKDTLVTFGGAYSNHIVAVAAAGKEFGFATEGIVRGEELHADANASLRFAGSCGMKLHFISRSDYQKKLLPRSLSPLLPRLYFIPEGGTNEPAVKGCAEITSHIKIPFDFICCAAGTGGTIAGIISSLKRKQRAIGFSVLKGDFLKRDVRQLISSACPPPGEKGWEINSDYHFGGYARCTPGLMRFISRFEKENNIPLDSVYTGKMFFGIYDLAGKNYFPKKSTIVAIHTGRLNGD